MTQPPSLPFSGAEYVRRLAATRVAMDAAELDALIVSDPANMAWLTGYDPSRFDAHRAVIVTRDGAPHWWGRAAERAGAQATVWMADKAVHAYQDALFQAEDAHPFTDLARLLRRLGLSRARIGLELDSPFFTAACIGHLLNEAGEARYVDATSLVDRRRAVKAAEELALMRRAGLIAARASAQIEEQAEAGLSKSALLSALHAALLAGGEDEDGAFAGEEPATAPVLSVTGSPAAAPAPLDGGPLAAGKPLTLRFAAAHQRYHCLTALTLRVGRAPKGFAAIEGAAQAALAAAMAAARPGAPASEPAKAAKAALRKTGADSAAAVFGRSIGLAYPPAATERALLLREGEASPLEAGMTLALEVWARPAGAAFGAVLGETVVIEEDGAAPLAAACVEPS